MSIVISVTKSFAIIWSVLTASGPLLFTGNGALGGFRRSFWGFWRASGRLSEVLWSFLEASRSLFVCFWKRLALKKWGTVTFFRCQDDFLWFWNDFGPIFGCQNAIKNQSGWQEKLTRFLVLIFNTFSNDFQVEIWIWRNSFHVMGVHYVSHVCSLQNAQNYCKIQYFWEVLVNLASLSTETLHRLCLQKSLQIWLCERGHLRGRFWGRKWWAFFMILDRKCVVLL